MWRQIDFRLLNWTRTKNHFRFHALTTSGVCFFILGLRGLICFYYLFIILIGYICNYYPIINLLMLMLLSYKTIVITTVNMIMLFMMIDISSFLLSSIFSLEYFITWISLLLV